AFALQANVAGRIIATGDLVHRLAVDDDLDGVAFADDGERVPFAGGIFGGGIGHLDAVLALGDGFVTGRAALEPEIALVIVHALAFDAVGPDGIGRRIGSAVLHEDADTGVDGFGHGGGETPFDGHFEIGIFLFRAHVAGGLAGAMQDAVGDAKGLS